MRLNLLSLAPDSFIFGPAKLLEQFYPKKIMGIPCVPEILRNNVCNKSCSICAPWGAEIHLTSKCQLRCSHCSYGQRNKEYSELDCNIVEKLLEALANLKVASLIFSGGGEPLAWEAGDFDNILKSNTSYTQAIATNALGFMTRITKDVLQRFDIIQVNVNGYDQQSFLSNTQENLFATFVENIEWIFRNRDKSQQQVTGKVTLDKNNYKNTNKYLEFCHKIGFDLIVLKLAGNFEIGQSVDLSLDQKKEVRDLIYSSSVINEYPDHLDGISTDDNSTEIELPQKCWVVDYGLYVLIRSNGDVFPCVASSSDSGNRIGNIYNNGLEEIWGSIKHTDIKNKLHNDMKFGKCNLNICRHMRYNYILDDNKSGIGYIKSLPKTNKEPKLL